jgi:hypothetical protein
MKTPQTPITQTSTTSAAALQCTQKQTGTLRTYTGTHRHTQAHKGTHTTRSNHCNAEKTQHRKNTHHKNITQTSCHSHHTSATPHHTFPTSPCTSLHTKKPERLRASRRLAGEKLAPTAFIAFSG